MEHATVGKPPVTIVITPRERFGEAIRSLGSVLNETPEPHELIYVSGRSPRSVLMAIDAMAGRHGFRHIKIDRLLSPNEARNIGARAANGAAIVFLDNDVFCAPGWLPPLLACAEETGADVVAPLTCHGAPLHTVVHQAGGDFATDAAAFFATPSGDREITEVMHHQNLKVAEVKLERSETQMCEFHAVLVRRAAFERYGPLDEEIMATKEHLDFCITVISAGGKVMFEPKSVVTYLFPSRHSPITPADWPFFMVRWSPEWQKRSFARFQKKWGLRDEGYLQYREKLLTFRLAEGVVKPLLRKVPLVGNSWRFQRLGRAVLTPLVTGVSIGMVRRDDGRRSRRAGTADYDRKVVSPA